MNNQQYYGAYDNLPRKKNYALAITLLILALCCCCGSGGIGTFIWMNLDKKIAVNDRIEPITSEQLEVYMNEMKFVVLREHDEITGSHIKYTNENKDTEVNLTEHLTESEAKEIAEEALNYNGYKNTKSNRKAYKGINYEKYTWKYKDAYYAVYRIDEYVLSIYSFDKELHTEIIKKLGL